MRRVKENRNDGKMKKLEDEGGGTSKGPSSEVGVPEQLVALE